MEKFKRNQLVTALDKGIARECKVLLVITDGRLVVRTCDKNNLKTFICDQSEATPLA